jgi:hypothetical protein
VQNELTAEQKRSYDNGIRIFARWIARAYISDMTEQEQAMNEAGKNIVKEKDDNGNQGGIRNNQVAQAGQNQAGRQKGKRRGD